MLLRMAHAKRMIKLGNRLIHKNVVKEDNNKIENKSIEFMLN